MLLVWLEELHPAYKILHHLSQKTLSKQLEEKIKAETKLICKMAIQPMCM